MGNVILPSHMLKLVLVVVAHHCDFRSPILTMHMAFCVQALSLHKRHTYLMVVHHIICRRPEFRRRKPMSYMIYHCCFGSPFCFLVGSHPVWACSCLFICWLWLLVSLPHTNNSHLKHLFLYYLCCK